MCRAEPEINYSKRISIAPLGLLRHQRITGTKRMHWFFRQSLPEVFFSVIR